VPKTFLKQSFLSSARLPRGSEHSIGTNCKKPPSVTDPELSAGLPAFQRPAGQTSNLDKICRTQPPPKPRCRSVAGPFNERTSILPPRKGRRHPTSPAGPTTWSPLRWPGHDASLCQIGYNYEDRRPPITLLVRNDEIIVRVTSATRANPWPSLVPSFPGYQRAAPGTFKSRPGRSVRTHTNKLVPEPAQSSKRRRPRMERSTGAIRATKVVPAFDCPPATWAA